MLSINNETPSLSGKYIECIIILLVCYWIAMPIGLAGKSNNIWLGLQNQTSS
jgi:hypothetical protein